MKNKIYITLLKKNKLIRSLLYPIILLRRKRAITNMKQTDALYDSVFKLVKGGTLSVRVDDHKGVFEFDFRSSILKRILLTGKYEDELMDPVKKYLDPEKDIIDIGANVGLFTVLFSKSVSDSRRVLAVEPVPYMQKLLKGNIYRNQCDHNVIVYNGLVSNNPRKYKLNVINGLEEYSSIGVLVHSYVSNMENNQIEVDGETIDNLVIKYNIEPGFIKIDTEGAEYNVLLGAKKVIARCRPVILAELSEKLLSQQGASCKDVFGFFRELNYKVLDISTMQPVSGKIEGEILAIPIV